MIEDVVMETPDGPKTVIRPMLLPPTSKPQASAPSQSDQSAGGDGRQDQFFPSITQVYLDQDGLHIEDWEPPVRKSKVNVSYIILPRCSPASDSK